MVHFLPSQVAGLSISRRGAPVGGEVTVALGGMLPGTPIIIGFGSLAAHELVAEVDTDAEGSISVDIIIPYWAELDQPHFFFYAFADQRPRGFSEALHVTAADGTARVRGIVRLTSDSGSCVSLSGPSETPYMLEGVIGSWAVGAQVSAVGTITEEPSCSGEGIPVAVRQIDAV